MGNGAWGLKLATDPDDVVDFLSGCGPYERPVRDARVTAERNGTSTLFHVFYQPALPDQLPENWAWKRASDPDDAMDFLNGVGAYCQPVKDTILASAWHDGRPEFYVFYIMELVPARIIDCQILQASVAETGVNKLRLGWRYCTGERPEKLLITVFHEQRHWKNIMPDGQSCLIREPERTAEADVMVQRLFQGPHKIVLHAFYSDHREMEYAFERLI